MRETLRKLKRNLITLVEKEFKRIEAEIKFCFECKAPADHWHHVVPQVRGGTKTIPLCEKHHGYVHELEYTNHSELTRIGMKKAKERGQVFGPKPKELDEANILKMNLSDGLGQREIAAMMGTSRGPVRRVLKKHGIAIKRGRKSLADKKPQ